MRKSFSVLACIAGLCQPFTAYAINDYEILSELEPALLGVSNNSSAEYILINGTADDGAEQGDPWSPGVYHYSDLLLDEPAPRVAFQSMGDAMWGLQVEGNVNIHPMYVTGSLLYGNGIIEGTSDGPDGYYKCKLEGLMSSPLDPDEHCDHMIPETNSDLELFPRPFLGDVVSGNGYAFLSVQPSGGTSSPVGLEVYAGDDSPLKPAGERIAVSGEVAGEVNGVVDARQDFLNGGALGLTWGNTIDDELALLSVTPGAENYDSARLPLRFHPDTTLPYTENEGLFAASMTAPGASIEGLEAGQVRVVFAAPHDGSTPTGVDYWSADFELAEDEATEVEGSARNLGVDGVANFGVPEVLRSRISNSGMAFLGVGTEEGDDSQFDILYLDTVTGDQGRLSNKVLLPEEAPFFAINECGSLAVTSMPHDFTGEQKSYLFLSPDCPIGEGNVLSVAPEETEINPAVTDFVDVDILLDNETVHGIDVACSADDTVLQLREGALGDLYPDDALVVGPSMVNNTWEVAVAPSGTNEPVKASGILATLTYEVLNTTGTTSVHCEAEASDGSGESVDISVQDATVAVDNGIEGGSAEVSGVVTFPRGDDHTGIRVTIHSGENQVSTYTNPDGSFRFDGIRDGAFSITYEAERHVADCEAVRVTGGENVELEAVQMIPGDINDDGEIDIGDFTILAAAYGTMEGDADFEPAADLNRDGRVGVNDLSILGSHFGYNMCEPDQEEEALSCGFDSLEDGTVYEASGVVVTPSGMSVTVELVGGDDDDGDFLEPMSSTTSSGGDEFSGVLMEGVPSLSDGETYLEIVFQGSEASDEIGIVGMMSPRTGTGPTVGFSPDERGVALNPEKSESEFEVLFLDVDIEPGYTLGFSVNHDTGMISVRDSEGNVHEAHSDLVDTGESLIAGTGAMPGSDKDGFITVGLNVMREDLVLGPPGPSQDWCGNAL